MYPEKKMLFVFSNNVSILFQARFHPRFSFRSVRFHALQHSEINCCVGRATSERSLDICDTYAPDDARYQLFKPLGSHGHSESKIFKGPVYPPNKHFLRESGLDHSDEL